jgi:putative copper export protein
VELGARRVSKDDLTLISILVHVPFVTFWIGLVMFDAFTMLSPALSTEQRARFIARTRWIAVIAVAVILLTGIWQTMENPFVKVDSWATLEKLRTKTYGQALFFKHICVFTTFALTYFTRFVLAPRLIASAETAPTGDAVAATSGLQRALTLATLLNVAACFGAVILAARMEIELH